MLKIYSDESLDVRIIEALKKRGTEAWSARDVGNLGLKDDAQLEYAYNEKACLFTTDDDFLRIAKKWSDQGKEHYGIIYVHPLKLCIGECVNSIEILASVMNVDDMINHVEYL